jgi:hypothetical protein
MTVTASSVPVAVDRHPATSRLLAAGIVAGPLFLGVGLAQASTRAGFDLDRHPLSLLALGPLGVVQIADFLVAGALLAAAAVGMRRAAGPGTGSTWGPRLVAGFGAGMVIAGLFVADPADGFPVGTPAGPGEISWHGTLHGVGFAVAMICWVSACLVLARWSAARGERGLAAVCVLALVGAVAVAASPQLGSLGVRLVLVSAVQFALVAAVCARLARTTR